MATITPTKTDISGDGSVVKYAYAAMLQSTSDVGVGIPFAQWADRSVQVTGTLGAAGAVTIEGSNDGGTTYHTLNDPSSTALTMNSLRIEGILEVCELVRPRVTAGDGTTSLNVYFILRRPNPMRT